MTGKRLMRIEGLGLCEHCGVLISVEDMSGDAMDGEWHCPKCTCVLSGLSFGYEGEGKETKKVKWVGPEGKWVAVKPTQDFEVGSWSILAVPLSHFY